MLAFEPKSAHLRRVDRHGMWNMKHDWFNEELALDYLLRVTWHPLPLPECSDAIRLPGRRTAD